MDVPLFSLYFKFQAIGGVEVQHFLFIRCNQKNHRYTIVNEEFSILEDSWTASEENKLLEALLQRGEGNWDEIGRSVGSQTPKQCQQHYEK